MKKEELFNKVLLLIKSYEETKEREDQLKYEKLTLNVKAGNSVLKSSFVNYENCIRQLTLFAKDATRNDFQIKKLRTMFAVKKDAFLRDIIELLIKSGRTRTESEEDALRLYLKIKEKQQQEVIQDAKKNKEL